MVFNLEFHLEFTKTNHFIKNAVQMNSQQLTYFYKCDEDSPKPTNNKHTNTDINIQRDTLTQTHTKNLKNNLEKENSEEKSPLVS